MSKRYSVWQAFLDKWPAGEVPSPDFECDALTDMSAAEKFAEKTHTRGELAVIVRDNQTGQYTEIEMVERWECLYTPRTLAELQKGPSKKCQGCGIFEDNEGNTYHLAGCRG
jgi:hypothetical protein